MKQIWLKLVFCTLLLNAAAAVVADDKKEKKADAKKETPKVALSGVFEAVNAREIRFDTEQISSAKIKKIVPHGSTVKKDDFIISFQRDAYNEQLKAAERKFASAKLSKQESDFAEEQFRRKQQLDRDAAERSWKSAQDSYTGYLEFDRQYAIDAAKFSLKQSRNSLEYQEEDLRQLERMYKEDELTEESEELVLTRARRAVESAKFYLRNTEVRTERRLNQTLPRDHESKKDAHERAKLAYEKAKLDLEIARKKKDLELDAAREAFEKEMEKLEELQGDRDMLVISSPANGIVFHGKLDNGNLSAKPSALKTDASVSKDQVIVTIANPKKLQIRSTVAEKDIAKLSIGMKGTAKPTADNGQKIDVEIKSLDSVPYAKGKYNCVLAIRGKAKHLLPTMTCSVTFELESNDDQDEQDDADDNESEKDDKGSKKDAK